MMFELLEFVGPQWHNSRHPVFIHCTFVMVELKTQIDWSTLNVCFQILSCLPTNPLSSGSRRW